VGTRGEIPAPATAAGPSLVAAPVGRHSEKPECFAELIEQIYPTLPKIELNRRGPARPGWGAWGNEVPQAVE
jgi:N6-adenosine-specific RNA methylase IME4